MNRILCCLGIAALATGAAGCATSTKSAPAIATCSSAASDTPWLDPANVASVERWRPREGKQMQRRDRGVHIYLKPQPGLTEPWLQELVDCARVRGGGNDPVAVDGVRTSVRRAGAGFVLRVKADSTAAAGEVMRRAEALSRT